MTSEILEGYLSLPELASQLRVCERTIYRWCDEPDGLPHVKLGAQRLFSVASVRTWLADRERQRNPTAPERERGRGRRGHGRQQEASAG
jgi:excisionase family DNA binding protein